MEIASNRAEFRADTARHCQIQAFSEEMNGRILASGHPVATEKERRRYPRFNSSEGTSFGLAEWPPEICLSRGKSRIGWVFIRTTEPLRSELSFNFCSIRH